MPEEDGRRRVGGAGPERSGAFVARLWQDEQGLRARIRHTTDLPAPEVVATVKGDTEQVLPELVGRFRQWVEEFAARTDFGSGLANPSKPDPDDEPMTGQ